MSFKKILIALDNSANSLHAAREGLALARSLGAEVAFVSVVDTQLAIGNPDAGIAYEDILQELRKESTEALEKAAHFQGFGQAEEYMPAGNPKDQILNVAAQWGADLIILGRDEHGRLYHMLAGSVCEYIVRHSAVPVLVLPTEHQAK